MVWNPSVYLAHADERTRPAVELLARVRSANPARVIDLGCGPGNSTALLAARWPHAHLQGLDSSSNMLQEARKSVVPAEWVEADLTSWTAPAKYDVIFSNATLQWLGEHAILIPRLLGFVQAGGTFAFQVPLNMDAPSHRLMREAAQAGPWLDKLSNVREVAVLRPSDYFDIFASHGAEVDIWETEYLHILDGDDPVYRWVSATGLRPFVQALSGKEQDDFVADYKQRLKRAYPVRGDGKTLFPFRRLFVVARV